MTYEYLKFYTVFFDADLNKYGVVRSDAAMYETQHEAEERAHFMNKQYAAASSLGSIKSEKKAAAARENGKKGGRPVTRL